MRNCKICKSEVPSTWDACLECAWSSLTKEGLSQMIFSEGACIFCGTKCKDERHFLHKYGNLGLHPKILTKGTKSTCCEKRLEGKGKICKRCPHHLIKRNFDLQEFNEAVFKRSLIAK